MVDLDALRKKFREEKLKSASPAPLVSDHIPGRNVTQEAEFHYHLAECYDRGLEGYEADEEKAMLEYLAAAELGHATAMTDVSSDYSDEENSILGFDLAKAEQWAKKAITLGNPDGYKGLFDVFECQGDGEKAINQLEIGISKGSRDCTQWLSFLLYYGESVAEYQVEQDEERAFKLLSSINWDKEHFIALEILGNIYWNRDEISNAKTCYEKALSADIKSYTVMSKLGSLLWQEKEVRDYPRAKELLTRAAENDIINAMNELGVMLYLGEGCEQDEKAAIHWIRMAAQKGHPTAMINLYDLLQEDNSDEALYWLDQAAKKGSVEAKERLQEMK